MSSKPNLKKLKDYPIASKKNGGIVLRISGRIHIAHKFLFAQARVRKRESESYADVITNNTTTKVEKIELFILSRLVTLIKLKLKQFSIVYSASQMGTILIFGCY